MADALDALLLDENDLARQDVAAGLQARVRLTRSGGVVLEPGFDELPAEHRVVCLLLALLALRMLGIRDTEAATPAEIVALSGMSPGTVRPKLSALLKARRVTKEGSRYSLAMHSARWAIEVVRQR